MSFTVSIEQFEGPLDLMLHLIREKQLNLFDLDIRVLTEQYLIYLRRASELKLEVASEYLVELATLIEYKSKRLLPKDETVLEESADEVKNRLVKRLLEYQQFKEITSDLQQLYEVRSSQMSKGQSREIEQLMMTDDTLPIDGSVYDLYKALSKCLKRVSVGRPIETKYTAKEVSMEDRTLQLVARFDSLPPTFSFETLIEDCDSLTMVIVTFLAILDLSRQKVLFFHVDENEVIWFTRGKE